MARLLEIKDLHTVFDTARGRISAVDGVTLGLDSGDTLGIVGESGCGKTMLALSIMNLVPANGKIVNGEIFFSGQDLLKISAEEMRKSAAVKLPWSFRNR